MARGALARKCFPIQRFLQWYSPSSTKKEAHIRITELPTLENQANQQNPKKALSTPLAMGKLMPHFFYLLYIILITLCSTPMFINSVTLHADIRVLRNMMRAIDPISISPSSYLSSWDFKLDPCDSVGGEFLGVLCSFPTDDSSSRITAIELDASGYDGFITPEIGNLTELKVINLSKNKFRGPIPETIANLKKLTSLKLSDNFFTGNVPAGLDVLKNLEYLDLSSNKLSGTVPLYIGGLRSLTYLSMSGNGFTGAIPDLSGLWQLRTLDLSNNQLYGILPNVPTGLRKLRLSHNILTGHLAPLTKLKYLRLLDVSNNRLSGAINREFFTLTKMVQFNVSINHFKTIEILRFLGPESQLQVLDANRNQLHGRLPINLVTLQNLTTINLSHNQFYGRIPDEYGARVGSWKSLYLDHNFLQGRLPSEFISSPERFKGSLSHNCLRCPNNLSILCGGQREVSECFGQDKMVG